MGRDPVDVAEQQRDYDETYGDSYTRLQERLNHELNEGDMKVSEDYKIHTDIPLPNARSGGRSGKWKQKAMQMQSGNCVFVPTMTDANSFARALKALGFTKVAIRKQGDGTYGVWGYLNVDDL